MIPFWFPYAVAVGVLLFCIGCLVVLFTSRRRPRLAVDDPAPDHEDALTALTDALNRGDVLTTGPWTGLHQGCADLWKSAAYTRVCDPCFDVLGRSEVSQ